MGRSYKPQNNKYVVSDGCTISRFDTSHTESRYLLSIPNGKKYSVSEDLVALITLLKNEIPEPSLVQELSSKLDIDVSSEEIDRFIRDKLVPAGIVLDNCSSQSNKPSAKSNGPLSLINKLSFTPHRLIGSMAQFCALFFSSPIVLLLLAISIFVMVLYASRGQRIPNIPLQLLDITPKELIITFAVTGFSTIVHELGHLSALSRYGIGCKALGLGWYLFAPIAYVDVSESWQLSRWKRVIVDLGGIYFQLLFCLLLLILQFVFNERWFLFCLFGVLGLVLTNLNPFVKYDGYWFFSDAIGIPNLHDECLTYMKRLVNRIRFRDPGINQRKHNRFEETCLSLYAFLMIMFTIVICFVIISAIRGLIQRYPEILISSLVGVRKALLAKNFYALVASGVRPLPGLFFIIGLVLLATRFFKRTILRQPARAKTIKIVEDGTNVILRSRY